MQAQLEHAMVGKLFVCAYVGARGSRISPLAGLLDSVFAQAIADDSQLEGRGASEGGVKEAEEDERGYRERVWRW